MKRWLIMSLVLILSFSLSTALIAGEEEKEEWSPKEGYGGVILGGLYMDLAELNSSFNRNNLASIKEENFTIGGFGYGVIGEKLIIGGEGGGFWQAMESKELKAKLYGVEALFDLGYVALRGEDWKLYPLMGVGFGIYQLKFIPALATPTFDQLLANPKQYASLRLRSFIMKVSLGIDRFIKVGKSRNQGSEKGMLVGLRLGYSWMPRSTGWKMRQMEILNSPKTSFGGYFFNIVIGGGGRD